MKSGLDVFFFFFFLWVKQQRVPRSRSPPLDDGAMGV